MAVAAEKLAIAPKAPAKAPAVKVTRVYNVFYRNPKLKKSAYHKAECESHETAVEVGTFLRDIMGWTVYVHLVETHTINL